VIGAGPMSQLGSKLGHDPGESRYGRYVGGANILRAKHKLKHSIGFYRPTTSPPTCSAHHALRVHTVKIYSSTIGSLGFVFGKRSLLSNPPHLPDYRGQIFW